MEPIKKKSKEWILFTSVQELIANVKIITIKPRTMGVGEDVVGQHMRRQAWFRLIFQAIITLLGLGGGFYLLLSKETSEDVKKFGSGLIGLVIGFWLK